MCNADKSIDRIDEYMIEYVKMSREHIDGLVKVEEQCFNSGFARQTFEKELENKLSTYVVALKDAQVVGYAGLWNICGEADIMNVGVCPDFRRMGIARGMLKKLIELCGGMQVFSINLEVRKSNYAAQKLYKKMGFEEVGIRPKYYENTEDAVLMKFDFKKEGNEDEDTCN